MATQCPSTVGERRERYSCFNVGILRSYCGFSVSTAALLIERKHYNTWRLKCLSLNSPFGLGLSKIRYVRPLEMDRTLKDLILLARFKVEGIKKTRDSA